LKRKFVFGPSIQGSKLDEEMIPKSLNLEEFVSPKSLEMVIDGLRCVLWLPFLQLCHKQALGIEWLNALNKQCLSMQNI